MSARAKFEAAMAECALHASVLAEAASALPAAFGAEDVAGIDPGRRRLLDQAAYRFMKLQDSLGEKVLPAVLLLALDPLPPDALFGEKLQRLERIGAVPSAQAWRTLREVRNSLAHEYPDHPALQAALLTRFVRGVRELLDYWEAVRRFVASRLPSGPER
jgi:hypothetical protein